MLITLMFFAVLAGGVMLLDRQSQRSVEAKAKVVDGDSLEIDGERYRLTGIDAPEFRQNCNFEGRDWPCGRESRQALFRLVRGKMVYCTTTGLDHYGRWLAICETVDGELNAEMVKLGWAMDYGGYAREEAAAKSRKIGIWKGEFERPSDWRRDNRDDYDSGKSDRAYRSPEWLQGLSDRVRSWWRAF